MKKEKTQGPVVEQEETKPSVAQKNPDEADICFYSSDPHARPSPLMQKTLADGRKETTKLERGPNGFLDASFASGTYQGSVQS